MRTQSSHRVEHRPSLAQREPGAGRPTDGDQTGVGKAATPSKRHRKRRRGLPGVYPLDALDPLDPEILSKRRRDVETAARDDGAARHHLGEDARAMAE